MVPTLRMMISHKPLSSTEFAVEARVDSSAIDFILDSVLELCTCREARARADAGIVRADPSSGSIDASSGGVDSGCSALHRVLDLLESGSNLITVEVDSRLASRTGECWILLKPSDALLDLVAAAWAGNV